LKLKVVILVYTVTTEVNTGLYGVDGDIHSSNDHRLIGYKFGTNKPGKLINTLTGKIIIYFD
jgi:hypothetical protein